MASPENSFDAGPPSPSPNLAFKPPSRPGASLKGRKSTAALSDIGTNRLHASSPSSYDADRASKNASGLPTTIDITSDGASTSRAPSPASSYDSPAVYEGAPSSKEAQALAATQAARQRLQALYTDNDKQTMAAGLLGQGLLEQRRQIEVLREELHDELSRLESGEDGSSTDLDRYQHIKSLADKIDTETADMAHKRKALITELLDAGGDQDVGAGATPLPASMSSPSQVSAAAYAFLASDPAARTTPTKNIPDVSITSPLGGGPTPRQSDRRARNAAAPSSIGDQNLVNQLQEGLVQEIRRLQGLLLQRDQQIKLSEEAQKKADEELALWKPKAMALMEQEDAMKQENWDLQVSGQQLEEQLEQERAAIRKLEAERSRATRELAKARETADERKVQMDGQAAELDRIHALRETETAIARREKASMQRDYSDLQTEMNKYKAEALKLERANVSRSASHSLLLDSMSGADDSADGGVPADVAAARRKFDSTAPASPGGFSEDISNGQSPLGSRLLRDREVADARGKLALAHKKAGKDSADKRRLREQNAELRRLLAKAGVDTPRSDDVETSDDGEEVSDWIDEDGSVSGRRRSRQSVRLPKSSTRPNIASRLGLAPTSNTSHDLDQNEEAEDSFEDATDDQSSDFADETGSDHHASAPKKYRRRSTIRPNQNKRVSMSSPLVQGMTLSEEAGDEAPEQDDDSFADVQPDTSVEEAITRRMPTARRSAAPKMRPASDAVPTSALGNELEELGSESLPDTSAARGADGSIIEHSIERELNDVGAQTDSIDGLLAPALAAQRAEHEAVLAKLRAAHQAEQATALEQLHTNTTSRHESAMVELQQRHKSRVDELVREHDENVTQLHTQHRTKLDEVVRGHVEALTRRDAKAAEDVSSLERSHETALTAKEAAGAAAVAAALATLSKKHESAMSESRARHTQSLADQVAAHTSALSQAERNHQAALAERERLHKADLEKRDHRHHRDLEERQREHQGMIEDINATNDAFVSQRDAAYNAALKDRDEQVVKARAEVTKLRQELEEMTAQLAQARKELAQALADSAKKVKDLEAVEATHAAALAAVNAQVDDIKREQAEAQAQEASQETPSPVTPAEPDSGRASPSHDVFQDASDEPLPSAPVEEEGVRRVVLADLKDNSVQTDDELWARTQQERLMLRPSSVAHARPGETAVGPGGITILGGYQGRPRDSVGTFGASNNYDRAVSPAPTSFSAHPAESFQRPSLDSSASIRRPSEVDRSKPPVMQVPPPPSMPPPSHIPRKSGASTISYVDDASAPPRPTSPPPATLLQKASGRPSTLRVPSSRDSEAGPRSVSRASSQAAGPPPSSYNGPAASIRKKLTRRASNVSAMDGDSVASASILSRLSGRTTPHHRRQTSGTSVASDVTSDLSRRPSFASSHVSEAIGDRTLTAADARRNSRGPAKGTNAGAPGALGDGESTDPKVIQAITQTMIGEYLYKYTRRTMRGGHSDKRHRRYFWVHPYTKMLYWTMTDPGGARMGEGVSKSACIEDVSVVEDANISPPGLFHSSIVIKTAARDLKVTAPDRERHETWLNALGYLVNRGNTATATADSNIVANATVTPAGTTRSRAATTSRAARLLSPSRSLASVGRTKSNDALGGVVGDDDDATPRARARNNSSAGVGDMTPVGTYRTKRRDTAAWEYLQNASTTRRAQSEMGFRNDDAHGSYYDEMGRLDNRLKTAEQMLEENEQHGEGFEGLDNVRACCDGAHDVGALAHKNYMQKQRRGSTQSGAAGSTRPSLGRPASRLSVGSTSMRSRTRGNSNASASDGAAVPPLPPQLGPLNLNGRSHEKPRTSGRQSTTGKASETFASMFDLPGSSTSSSRPRSSQAAR